MQIVTSQNIRSQPLFNIKEVLDTNSSGTTIKTFYSQTNKIFPRIILETSFKQIGKDVKGNVKHSVTATITVVETTYKKADVLSTELKNLMEASVDELAIYKLDFDSEGGDIGPFKQGDNIRYGAVLNYIYTVV